MDVAYTEHSHVIGKGGGNIKKVMEVTSCHIHFPDSNRHNAAGEKSNQVTLLLWFPSQMFVFFLCFFGLVMENLRTTVLYCIIRSPLLDPLRE